MTTPDTKPTIQDRLKAALGKYTHADDRALAADLISNDKTDAEVSEAVHAAQLKRANDSNAALKNSLAEKDKEIAKLSKQGGKVVLPNGGNGNAEGDGPNDIHAALSKHAADLKGMPMQQRIAHMHELYPDLKR